MASDDKFCIHYFVVISEPKLWPYSGEVPYAAWPTKSLIYDSWGNDSKWPEGRDWSYISLMDVSTRETILAVDTAAVFNNEDDLQQVNGVFEYQDERVIWTQLGHIPIRYLGMVPCEYRGSGNVYIGSVGSDRVGPSALVARLFMQGLDSKLVWDGQTNVLRSREEIEMDYLQNYSLESVDHLMDEIHNLCTSGDSRRWYEQALRKKYHLKSEE